MQKKASRILSNFIPINLIFYPRRAWHFYAQNFIHDIKYKSIDTFFIPY